MIGIDKNEVKEFISKEDKGAGSPTVFLIGNISNAQKISLIGTAITADGKVNSQELQARAIEILKMGLKGIRGLYSPAEKKSVNVEKITDEVVDAIPFQVLYEVVGEIVKYNFEMGDVAKN